MNTQTLDRTSPPLLAGHGDPAALSSVGVHRDTSEPAGGAGFVVKVLLFGAGAPLLLAAGLFKAYAFFGPEILSAGPAAAF